MQAVYHATVGELSVDFIDLLKKQFANARVDIIVHEQDDTEYLNSSEKNRELLEKSINEVENGILIARSEADLGIR